MTFRNVNNLPIRDFTDLIFFSATFSQSSSFFPEMTRLLVLGSRFLGYLIIKDKDCEKSHRKRQILTWSAQVVRLCRVDRFLQWRRRDYKDQQEFDKTGSRKSYFSNILTSKLEILVG